MFAKPGQPGVVRGVVLLRQRSDDQNVHASHTAPLPTGVLTIRDAA
jgi:hypothetical protein